MDERSSNFNKSDTDHLEPRQVNKAMCYHACYYLTELSVFRVFILAVMGGGFITVGALFSILLATDIQTIGVQRLMEGFGFSTGFFFVILSQSVLFTEANVILPVSMLHLNHTSKMLGDIFRFWGIAWLGNFVGALITGWAIHFAQIHHHYRGDLLHQIIAMKLQYRETGGVVSWIKIILSGMLANWLVGMAAFFATMAKTIIGKYIPIFLAVSLFVVANFQHSPANMAYFSLYISAEKDLSWISALLWNIIPAGIGNMLGGALLVALPFWYVFTKTEPTSHSHHRSS